MRKLPQQDFDVFSLYDESSRFARSVEAAVEIVALLDADRPGGPAERFGRIVFVILQAMNRASGDLDEKRLRPSRN